MLVNPEGPNPIAHVGFNLVNKQFGYDGDFRINQTVTQPRSYGPIYTLGDLYTKLVEADQDIVTLLDTGSVRESGSDFDYTTTPEQANLVFYSKWPGLFWRSFDRTVTVPERRSSESRIDEIVSTFEIEFLKKGLRRRKIAGNIAYLL